MAKKATRRTAERPSETDSQRAEALKRLGAEGNRVILSLDGGGIRGILTLQLLKHLEQIAGVPCYELFDMVAGTSTGAIIAGLIATGRSAHEIESLYDSFVTRVFTRRSLTANRLVFPPAYSKRAFVAEMKSVLGDISVKEACERTGIDLMITAKDVASGEETFFSYFRPTASRPNREPFTYEDVLLRATMEATMSAPTYFYPLERFVDGGVTAYNNPSAAALIEALNYSYGRYDPTKITVLSFGTGIHQQFVELDKIETPPGIDVRFWLTWLLQEAGQDASEHLVNLLRSKQLVSDVDFRRFQISLDSRAIKKLPNRPLPKVRGLNASWLYELTDQELGNITLDAVAYFPVMKQIGLAMRDQIAREAAATDREPYSFDLTDAKNRDLLVTRDWDTVRIRQQMSSPDWLDRRKRR